MHQDAAPALAAGTAQLHDEQVVVVLVIDLPYAVRPRCREPGAGVDLSRRNAEKLQDLRDRIAVPRHQDILSATIFEDPGDELAFRAVPGVLDVRFRIEMRHGLPGSFRIAVVDRVEPVRDFPDSHGKRPGSMQSFFGELVAAPARLLRMPDDQDSRFDFSCSADALDGACTVRGEHRNNEHCYGFRHRLRLPSSRTAVQIMAGMVDLVSRVHPEKSCHAC